MRSHHNQIHVQLVGGSDDTGGGVTAARGNLIARLALQLFGRDLPELSFTRFLPRWVGLKRAGHQFWRAERKRGHVQEDDRRIVLLRERAREFDRGE